jgi:polyphosphate kinase 2
VVETSGVIETQVRHARPAHRPKVNGARTGKAAEVKKAKAAKEPKAEKPARLSNKRYEKELRKLQTELCALQDWVVATGAKVIVVFEGRDTAGKGGIIKAIAERTNPRVFRIVALPAPSERQKSQLFMQRYIEHFPAGGEVVIFDRSWYNRAGVEFVMDFITEAEHRRFLALCPYGEKWIVEGGIILIKLWLEVGMKEQEKRIRDRATDPLKRWKLSPMDLESYPRWYEYSHARDMLLDATDTDHAPWFILPSDDKKRARLNGISHILSHIPYERIEREKVAIPKRSTKHKYDDALGSNRRFVRDHY